MTPRQYFPAALSRYIFHHLVSLLNAIFLSLCSTGKSVSCLAIVNSCKRNSVEPDQINEAVAAVLLIGVSGLLPAETLPATYIADGCNCAAFAVLL